MWFQYQSPCPNYFYCVSLCRSLRIVPNAVSATLDFTSDLHVWLPCHYHIFKNCCLGYTWSVFKQWTPRKTIRYWERETSSLARTLFMTTTMMLYVYQGPVGILWVLTLWKSNARHCKECETNLESKELRSYAILFCVALHQEGSCSHFFMCFFSVLDIFVVQPLTVFRRFFLPSFSFFPGIWWDSKPRDSAGKGMCGPA